MYLGRPPVDIGTAKARSLLSTMMRGGSFYSGWSGFPVAPEAKPQLQAGRLPSPAQVNRNPVTAAFYPLAPAAFKVQLRQQFGG